MNAPVNPQCARAIKYLTSTGKLDPESRIADQGCGCLRHLTLFLRTFGHVVAVDTREQLSKRHRLGESTKTIYEYVQSCDAPVSVATDEEFAESRLALDAVFSVAVFDVVPCAVRQKIISSAKKNIRRSGYYVVIVPRNDSSILKRCSDDNRWEDGHVFANRGALTFYRNFRKSADLITPIESMGFTLEQDLSLYRQLCLVFRR